MVRVRGVRTGAVVAVGALVAALFSVVPAAVADDVPAARTGTLTEREPGHPATAEKSRRLQSAQVRQDLDRGRLTATVVLEGAPTAATDSRLFVVFANRVDGQCNPSRGAPHDEVTQVLSPSSGFSRNGRTLTMTKDVSDAKFMNWDCAYAILASVSGETVIYDALFGNLTDIPSKPELRISSVLLLNKDRKKVKFVRNTWTPLTVRVENDGRVDALGVKIVSGNKAFKVRKGKVGKVWADGSTAARIEVRLVKKSKRAKLRLVARNNKARGATTRNAVRVAKPRKPVAGKYRAAKGKITFAINKKGRVTNFRAKGVQMVCQPPLSYASYQRVTVTYPRKAKVRPNGILDAQVRWKKGNAWYNAGLQMRVVGKKITQARYTYTTANYCRVIENFKPKRR